MLFVGNLAKSPRSDNESVESYICPYCDLDKKDSRKLSEHINSTHSSKEEGLYRCYFCWNPYKSRNALEEHRINATFEGCRVHPRDYYA